MPKYRERKVLKAIILGDSGVGKTSILNRFVDEKYSHQYRATIGADFMTKVISVDGQEVTLQIWDTAGQERFQSLGVAFYRGADCCVLVYDLTVDNGEESLETWKNNFISQTCLRNDKSFPFLALGNKSDARSQIKVGAYNVNKFKVDIHVVERWCSRNKMYHFVTSAVTGDNIIEAFTTVVKAALINQEKDTDYL